eukprot:3016131-Prymnesium_polylepis.2
MWLAETREPSDVQYGRVIEGSGGWWRCYRRSKRRNVVIHTWNWPSSAPDRALRHGDFDRSVEGRRPGLKDGWLPNLFRTRGVRKMVGCPPWWRTVREQC